MFLAKYLDQKQGEARVVDQQQVLSARLDQWLKVRPSASDLSDRGILGCGHRYKEARDIVDSFLQSRLQRLEEELAQIPAGNEIYPDRVLEILDGCQIDDANPVKSSMRELSYDDLQSQEAARSSVVQRLAVAGETWKHAASDCRRVVCTLSLRETSNSAHEALSVLETQRTSANSSLADVFSQLESCERLTARHRGLEAIVAMTEKTDAIRDAVFACGSDAPPLSVLEGLPEMCSRLPSSSRAVGSQRALFLVSQIRTVLVQDCDDSSRRTRFSVSFGEHASINGSLLPPTNINGSRLVFASIFDCSFLTRLGRCCVKAGDLRVRLLIAEQRKKDIGTTNSCNLWVEGGNAQKLTIVFHSVPLVNFPIRGGANWGNSNQILTFGIRGITISRCTCEPMRIAPFTGHGTRAFRRA